MSEEENIGRQVADRYRLDELLGRGGYGSVYRGWDTQFERDVAVKLLDVGADTRTGDQITEMRERFRREAMSAGRINHRCVVTIYDFGVPDDGGEAYIVMELLEGRDLGEEIDTRGPLEPERALRLFVPMLEALGLGHDLGIVHKDIKPQNIFIRNAGQTDESMCLVDFGVARVVHEQKLTLTGLIVGTPQYLAPEYITETIVTPALDVYQMGLIIAEALSGIPAVPLGESFIRSCNRHFTGDLDIPDELLEGELGEVLKAALDPIADKRIANAAELGKRLAAVNPRSIAMEKDDTLRFDRPDPEARRTSSMMMHPPVRPEQVSERLEQIARDPSLETNDWEDFDTAPTQRKHDPIPGKLGMTAPVPAVKVEMGRKLAIKAPQSRVRDEADSEEMLPDAPKVRVPDSLPETIPPASEPSPVATPAPDRVPVEILATAAQEPGPARKPAPAATASTPVRPRPSAETNGEPRGRPKSNRTLIVVAAVMAGAVVLVFAGILYVAATSQKARDAEAPPVVTKASPPSPKPAPPPEPVEGKPSAVPGPAMELRTSPSGATVSVDGVDLLTTPARIELDRVEQKSVEVRLDGYRPQEVELRPGERTVILRPLRGKRTPKSQPPAGRQQVRQEEPEDEPLVAGEPFIPEEPDLGTVEEPDEPDAGPPAPQPVSPQKWDPNNKPRDSRMWQN